MGTTTGKGRTVYAVEKVCEAISILSSACIVVGTLLLLAIGVWLIGKIIQKRNTTQIETENKDVKMLFPVADRRNVDRENSAATGTKNPGASTVNSGYFGPPSACQNRCDDGDEPGGARGRDAG
jgi:hypothetical protein